VAAGVSAVRQIVDVVAQHAFDVATTPSGMRQVENHPRSMLV
jgi:hypothetical protein